MKKSKMIYVDEAKWKRLKCLEKQITGRTIEGWLDVMISQRIKTLEKAIA